MRRREFITLLAGSAAMPLMPLAARAQQPKLPIIGFLGASTASAISQWTAAFVQRLRDLGWVDGRTVVIDYQWGEGRPKRFAEIADDFVKRKADVIVTHSNAAVLAAKRATSVIPIVFGAAGDPVGAGMVSSLARPGGNVTGMSLQQTDTATKRLELLREVAPDVRRLSILTNTNNSSAVLERNEVQSAVERLGLQASAFELRRAEDLAPAFDALSGKADALYFCNDPLLTAIRVRIGTLAAAARLPTIFNFQENVEAGGLMSYGANVPDLFRRAAALVDRILRGAKPADIPVEQPTKFDLVVNLTTARAIGLKIPEAFLLRADEVIE